MRSRPVTAADFLPSRRTLPALREAANDCEGCELFRRATQTVFGEGRGRAALMLVGEQPGDAEDQAGEPFVGPAGQLLRELLSDGGIAPGDVYLTNAVKHFRWEPRGKRRLHAKPMARHVNACRPWLEAEITAVQPKLIVCLGATASLALLGRGYRLTRQRGEVVHTPDGRAVVGTFHPSAVLRAPTSEQREALRRTLRDDLGDAIAFVRRRHGR